jgi:hypothetical protein
MRILLAAATACLNPLNSFVFLKQGPLDADLPIVNMRSSHAQKDPLYIIFEQHLLNFQDPEVDRKTLILTIVSDYLTLLRKKSISVPRSLEAPVVEELAEQVNTMLVKKMYGCLTIRDFQRGIGFSPKRRARARYRKLKAA